MYKKIILTLALLSLTSSTFATNNSCENYEENTKNICNSASTTKADFYNKYAMKTSNPTEDKRETISSCNKLSALEKDTCITKNKYVSNHSLAKPIPSTSEITKQQQPANVHVDKASAPVKNPMPQSTQDQEQKPVQEVKSVTNTEQKPTQEQSIKSTKVNIFNN